MSYDISFRVRVEDSDNWVDVGSCEANTTWNLREMIVKSTGLEWNNEADNGLCKDVIPHIINGYRELCEHPDKYSNTSQVTDGEHFLGVRSSFWTLSTPGKNLQHLMKRKT